MSYYWKVNGESACASELTLDERLEPPTRCAYANRVELESVIARFSKLYPEAVIEVVEGSCDDPGRDVGYRYGDE